MRQLGRGEIDIMSPPETKNGKALRIIDQVTAKAPIGIPLVQEGKTYLELTLESVTPSRVYKAHMGGLRKRLPA